MYILEIALMSFLLGCIFYAEKFTKIIIAIVLFVFMIISQKSIKTYKSKSRYNKKVTFLMITIGIVYLLMIYTLGIYISFYDATIKFSIWTLINYILPYIVIIISIENIRKTILLKDEKKAKIIILTITVMLDIVLATNIYNLKTLRDYFM